MLPASRAQAARVQGRKMEMAQRLEMCLDRRDKTCRDLFRCLGRQGGPDFGKVGFGRVGEAEG